MITFENLSFSYGNTGEEQLNSLDLQIKKGGQLQKFCKLAPDLVLRRTDFQSPQ